MRTTTEWAGVIMAAAEGEPLEAAHNVAMLVAACQAEVLREQRNDQPTLRDRFAMAALPSFLTLEAEELGYEGASAAAYGVSDAMLCAREGKRTLGGKR